MHFELQHIHPENLDLHGEKLLNNNYKSQKALYKQQNILIVGHIVECCKHMLWREQKESYDLKNTN